MQNVLLMVGIFVLLLFLVLMGLVPCLEDTLLMGYHVDIYDLDESKQNRIYRVYQNHQHLVELVHKLMLGMILILPWYVVFTLGDYYHYYYFGLIVVLLYVYRKSYTGIPTLLKRNEKKRLEDIASNTIYNTKKWIEKTGRSPDEILRERIDSLQYPRPQGINLSSVEIEIILKFIMSESEDLKPIATQMLEESSSKRTENIK